MGDSLMALSYGLCAGFTGVMPYFYWIYLSILLVHRAQRDDTRCRSKYGASWEEYCRRVPWRIVPYVY